MADEIIKEVKLALNGTEIFLKVEDARKLQDALNKLFGREEIKWEIMPITQIVKEYIPCPQPYPVFPQPYTPYIWPFTPYAICGTGDFAGSKLAYSNGAASITI